MSPAPYQAQPTTYYDTTRTQPIISHMVVNLQLGTVDRHVRHQSLKGIATLVLIILSVTQLLHLSQPQPVFETCQAMSRNTARLCITQVSRRDPNHQVTPQVTSEESGPITESPMD